MLLLNELASYRAKIRSNSLEQSDIAAFAASVSSCDDIETLITFASGHLGFSSDYIAAATSAAYFQGGLSNFGNQEVHILERDDALGLLLSVSPVMKQCVLDCNDSSAWKFLCMAMEVERREGNDYTESSQSVRALNATLSQDRLMELKNGTANVSQYLIARFEKSIAGKGARLLWQLKQYADEDCARQTYRKVLTQPGDLKWLSLQSLLFFSKVEDVGYLCGLVDGILSDAPQNGTGRVAVTAESVANVIATCALRLKSSNLMRRLADLKGLEQFRLTSLVKWVENRLHE